MQSPDLFSEFQSPVATDLRQDVAVIGGDVASVIIAYSLLQRGHRVVWYRGQDCNPHPVSGVLRNYAVEPLALPGYPLCLLNKLLRTATRGKLQGDFSKQFIGWLMRGVALSRPLAAEKITADRAELLKLAEPAFAALSGSLNMAFSKTELLTVYTDARAHASQWSVHDFRQRHGVSCRDVGYDELTERFPHLMTKYAQGVSVADVPVITNADAVVEQMKEAINKSAEIVRHWPQTVQPTQDDKVEVHDNGSVRSFDWVIRGDDGGPHDVWPSTIGAASLAISYRERHLLRHAVPEVSGTKEENHVLEDGRTGAWMELTDGEHIAAGAHCVGGFVHKELRYLTAASYARLWRELAGGGWHTDGGRVSVSRGSVLPDSRPSIGVASGRILEASGFAEASWTLGAVAGFAMLAFVEGRTEETLRYQAFNPDRFN